MMAAGYQVGALTEYLDSSVEKKKPQAKKKKEDRLAAMFAASKKGAASPKAREEVLQNVPTSAAEKSPKKTKAKLLGKKKLLKNNNGTPNTSKTTKKNTGKRSHEDSDDDLEAVEDEFLKKKLLRLVGAATTQEEAGASDAADAKVTASVDKTKKMKWAAAAIESPSKEETERNTLFVGNLTNSVKRPEIEQLFKKYGNIVSVRFRSAMPPDLKTPKRVAVIKRQFHANRRTLHAYVRFDNSDAVQAALEMNGKVFKNLHLRVDASSVEQKHDSRRSVFVGNLPYVVEEEVVWKHFEDCGEVEGVRIIRDNRTGIGKGFGYVLFKTADSVQLALRMDDKPLNGRNIRVKRAVNVTSKQSNNARSPKGVKMASSPSNPKTTFAFQGTLGVLNQIKKKKLKVGMKSTQQFGKKKLDKKQQQFGMKKLGKKQQQFGKKKLGKKQQQFGKKKLGKK